MFIFIIIWSFIGLIKCTPKTYYNIGVLMASRLDSPFDLERCGPAVDLALDVVNKQFLSQHNVELRKIQASYPSCSGAKAPGLAADMYFKHDVIAFVGPACALALEPVARLAAYWNTPIITGMGDQPPSEGELSVPSGILTRLNRWKNGTSSQLQPLFDDKSKYPTLTRMSYCQCRLTLVFASIFKRFGWYHVALLLDRSDLFSLTVGKNLESGLRREGLLKVVRELDGNDQAEDIDAYLNDVSMYARVVILSVRGTLVRKFMLAAHDLGMTKGDWTFLDVQIFQGQYWDDHGWSVGDQDDTSARAAYESLLRVSLRLPASDTFQDFTQDVRRIASESYNYTFADGEDVNFFIGAFYDGVVLLGMALNETLNDFSDIRDGRSITKRMWGRDFHGITGHVRIDSNGDRDADYSILDLDPITGKFEVVAYYYGLNRTYLAVPGKRIHWPGGRRHSPPDKPRCGFLGNDPLCKGESETMMFYGFLGLTIFLTVLTTLSCFAYKQVRLSAELNNMSWRIRPEEVLLEVAKPVESTTSTQKVNEALKAALGIDSGGSNRGPVVGLYKGSRVVVRRLHRRKLDLNKKLLWEIKEVRDVSHENTARFIGACVDTPLLFILIEYCPKGSLKDLLSNDQLHLDWNFRMSLVNDIVKGMCYIHASSVSCHGRLRSSNCLIDGRFVVKISDFGLTSLIAPAHPNKDETYFYKMLWTAPELICDSIWPGAVASQKGDVYSFAIILEEIILRGGPYDELAQRMTHEEIVTRVSARENPPFRPTITSLDCPADLRELAERCWSEIPDERPAFDAIKNNIRGYCENLMDDLLGRMEQYANNLESLVEEKTEQLSMEKRRSEELLYQVLPRPVAQQLMSGEMVQPESFECVTVYFSDIVGFTQICASSTPMQVVNMLNDLYSTFDRIIGSYDVYKVETIGDAYMVVSGLPERNETDHAREVSLLALAVVEAVRATTHLEIRIGIHSGPVCAGVVGVKMPHYCLFGDTVNVASRMESSGLPLRIHISDSTKMILEQQWGTFIVETRGEIDIKGKGRMLTHWLISCTETIGRASSMSTPPVPGEPPYPLLCPALTDDKPTSPPSYLVVDASTLHQAEQQVYLEGN